MKKRKFDEVNEELKAAQNTSNKNEDLKAVQNVCMRFEWRHEKLTLSILQFFILHWLSLRSPTVGSSFFILLLLLSGCARMGQPDGGWYDDDPPKVVTCTPADRQAGVKTNKVTITFDEFIKLEDATNKVIVSPPQLETPEIKAQGKRIVVELKDTLKENTTYTIDFGDAISDNNEGNPMGNFTYSFSTGAQIDTCEVSGTVIDASNLEPIKGIMVGLYKATDPDSAFTTQPLMRISRTDSRGHFVIKGIAPGKYRACALQDADGNFMYSQKSEMIAFSHDTFEPESKPDVRQDTIWRDSLKIDSIIRVPYIHYYPDDIVLKAFTCLQTDRYLIKTERKDPEKFSLYFSYGDSQLPELRGLDFDSDSAFVVEHTEKMDTIHYWLCDTMLVNRDTLTVEARYMMTDSTGLLVCQTDTIELLPKMSYEKRMKDRQKEMEKWHKQMEKKKKRGEEYDSIWREKPLTITVVGGGNMAPDQNVTLTLPTPVERFDTAKVHLYTKIDTLWYNAKMKIVPTKNVARSYTLMAEWREGGEYSLEIDSAAIVDIYGKETSPLKQGLKVEENDKFSTLQLKISGNVPDSAAVMVQLLNNNDAIVKEVKVADGTADFFYLKPGEYYARAFIDINGNGKWDTGDFYKDLQPEDVFYYTKKIECKEKWDLSLAWDLTAANIARQKPQAITKQKADKEQKLRNRNAERAKKLGISYSRRQTGL